MKTHTMGKSLLEQASRRVVVRIYMDGNTILLEIFASLKAASRIAWFARLHDQISLTKDGLLPVSEPELLGFQLKVWTPNGHGKSPFEAAEHWLSGCYDDLDKMRQAKQSVCLFEHEGEIVEMAPHWTPLVVMCRDYLTRMTYELQRLGVINHAQEFIDPDSEERAEGCAVPVGIHRADVLAVIRTRFANYVREISGTAFGGSGVPIS